MNSLVLIAFLAIFVAGSYCDPITATLYFNAYESSNPEEKNDYDLMNLVVADNGTVLCHVYFHQRLCPYSSVYLGEDAENVSVATDVPHMCHMAYAITQSNCC